MTNTPHSRALEAAERFYKFSQGLENSYEHSIKAYLQTLLNDPETVKRVQKAFHRADENGMELEKCWKAALRAIMEGL